MTRVLCDSSSFFTVVLVITQRVKGMILFADVQRAGRVGEFWYSALLLARCLRELSQTEFAQQHVASAQVIAQPLLRLHIMCAALTLSEYHWHSYATPDVCTLIVVAWTLLTVFVRYFALSFIRYSIVMVVHYPWCSFTWWQDSKSASRTLYLVFCVVLVFSLLRTKDHGFSGWYLGNFPHSLCSLAVSQIIGKKVKFFHKSCVKMAVL